MAFLVFGVIVNDVAAYLGPGTSTYIAAAHQTSILMIFFAAFLAGIAAMYDIMDKQSGLTLGRGTAVYASIVWCTINSFWAGGFYLLQAAATSDPISGSLNGFDTPFSFGFYTPLVPRTIMIAYNVMNLFAVYLIWKRKTVQVALGGIFLPVIFVNLYAVILGKVLLLPLAVRAALTQDHSPFQFDRLLHARQDPPRAGLAETHQERPGELSVSIAGDGGW